MEKSFTIEATNGECLAEAFMAQEGIQVLERNGRLRAEYNEEIKRLRTQ